jgi:hypothetical protein
MAHPIAARAEAWWQEHGGRHDSPEWNAFLANVAAKIPLKLKELSEEHTNNGRFGMSKAGGCTRAAALKLLGYDPEPFTGSTRFTFFVGHVLEVVGGICTLEALGYKVDGLQNRVSIDPFMESSSDGVLDLDGTPTILSVKSTGYKMSGFDKRSNSWRRFGFAQLPHDGVLGSFPSYYAQGQAEMLGSGITQTLVFVVAKDIIKSMQGDPSMKKNGSLTFYAELIPADRKDAAELRRIWQHQWALAKQSADPGPAMYFTKDREWIELDALDREGKGGTNATLTGTFNPCGYCDLADTCKASAIKEKTA